MVREIIDRQTRRAELKPNTMATSLYRTLLMCSVFIAALMTLPCVSASTVVPTFAVEPADTTAAERFAATLYCSIADLGRHQVFWSIENTQGQSITLGPDTNSHTSYPRFQFTGNAATGDFHLLITDVTAEDAGEYICIVHDPNLPANTLEAKATLTVQETTTDPLKGYPTCSRNPTEGDGQAHGVYLKGDILTLTCTSTGGIPLPELAWVRVRFNKVVQSLPSKTSVSGGVVTTTSMVVITSTDHQSFYKCIETHAARPDRNRTCPTPFMGSESRLDVRFAPEVKLTPNVVSVHLLETSRVTLSCTAYGNPPLIRPATIEVHDGNNSPFYPRGIDDKTLVEVQVTTADVGKDFFCTAENELGVREARAEVRRLPGLQTWLILTIIAAISGAILIVALIVCCCCCFFAPEGGTEKQKQGRAPGRENGLIDGFNNEMVPIEDFAGGQESPGLQMGQEIRYQNVNAALESYDGDEQAHGNTSYAISPIDSD